MDVGEIEASTGADPAAAALADDQELTRLVASIVPRPLARS